MQNLFGVKIELMWIYVFRNKFIRLLIAGALLWFVIKSVDGAQLSNSLSSLTLPGIALLIAISLVLLLVSAIKWRFFISACGQAPSLVSLMQFYLIGYLVNLWVPSFVSTDVVRGWYLGKRTSAKSAAASTLLDRYTSILAVAFFGLAAMPLAQGVTPQMKWGFAILCLGLAILSLLFAISPLLVSWMGKHPSSLAQRVAPFLEKCAVARSYALEHPGLMLKTLLAACCVEVLMVLNVYACAWAIGCDTLNLWALAVAVPLILALSSIPLTPAGLGIQENVFLYFLQSLGANSGQALSVALLMRAKLVFLAFGGWVAWTQVKVLPDEGK